MANKKVGLLANLLRKSGQVINSFPLNCSAVVKYWAGTGGKDHLMSHYLELAAW